MTEITKIDILREWFGGERYARDYEYLDASFGKQADQVLAYLAALAQDTAPADAFARWLEDGPRLAKAAGCYVGIKVTDKPENR